MKTLTFDQLSKEVKVTYPDNKGNKTMTIEQIKERFAEESPEWIDGFIEQIFVQGYAYTRFGGKYELIK